MLIFTYEYVLLVEPKHKCTVVSNCMHLILYEKGDFEITENSGQISLAHSFHGAWVKIISLGLSFYINKICL